MARLSRAVFKRPAFVAVLLVSVLFFYGCSTEERDAKAPAQSETTEADRAHAKAGSEAAKMETAKAHFDKAVEHARAREFKAAIDEYTKSLEVNPNSAEANSNLGFAYMDSWDFDRSLKFQLKALEVNPEFANAYYGLALTLEKKGDKAGAAENWKEFIKRSEPGSKWALMAKERLDALE
jgi:tetratricopeptide (TPR) repeat protein